jgi:hypothetical protein
MAVISDDHAHESMCMEASTILSSSSSSSSCLLVIRGKPRPISPEDILENNNGPAASPPGGGGRPSSSFWAVVDGWVIDATEFVDSHPGGLKKLMSTDAEEVGSTGMTHGFSFSRGKNAHFPDTGRRFGEGVVKYLRGDGATTTATTTMATVTATAKITRGCDNQDEYLPPGKVSFPPHGSILILGRLSIEG